MTNPLQTPCKSCSACQEVSSFLAMKRLGERGRVGRVSPGGAELRKERVVLRIIHEPALADTGQERIRGQFERHAGIAFCRSNVCVGRGGAGGASPWNPRAGLPGSPLLATGRRMRNPVDPLSVRCAPCRRANGCSNRPRCRGRRRSP